MPSGGMTVSEAGKKGGTKRGQCVQGQQNPNAKLSRRDARDIKDAKGRESAIFLGTLYGCHPEHIRKIWRGEYWKDA